MIFAPVTYLRVWKGVSVYWYRVAGLRCCVTTSCKHFGLC